MNRNHDAGNPESARHISMELTADGARVTSLSLHGQRLVLTIEAELTESQLQAESLMEGGEGGAVKSRSARQTDIIIPDALLGAPASAPGGSDAPGYVMTATGPDTSIKPLPLPDEPATIHKPFQEMPRAPGLEGILHSETPALVDQFAADVAGSPVPDAFETIIDAGAPSHGVTPRPGGSEALRPVAPIALEPEPMPSPAPVAPPVQPVPAPIAPQPAPVPIAPQPVPAPIAPQPAPAPIAPQPAVSPAAPVLPVPSMPAMAAPMPAPAPAPVPAPPAVESRLRNEPAASISLGNVGEDFLPADPALQFPETATLEIGMEGDLRPETPAPDFNPEPQFGAPGSSLSFGDAPEIQPAFGAGLSAAPAIPPLSADLGDLGFAPQDTDNRQIRIDGGDLSDPGFGGAPAAARPVSQPAAPQPAQLFLGGETDPLISIEPAGPARTISPMTQLMEMSGQGDAALDGQGFGMEPAPAPSADTAWGGGFSNQGKLPVEESLPKPLGETWTSGDPGAGLGVVTEESSAVGGDRHGEPQPGMSFGLDSGPLAMPALKSEPRPEAKQEPAFIQPEPPKAQAPAPAPELASPPSPRPQPQPQPQPEPKKSPEAGGTTILIRYTCPKCKTQGMQAVDKVGTVVNCSNCGKAMRLVMKK